MLREECERHGLSVAPEFRVWRWVVDMALPEHRLAIECDGDYWHRLPGAAERDARKDADLAARGWTVLRFWERDIRESPAACVDRVLAYIAQHQQSA